MKYAIDYRSMHTAIHGLILFNNNEVAEQCLDLLKSEDDDLINDVFCCCDTVIDEVDYRELNQHMKNIKYSINENGHVHPAYDDITIINYNNSIDVYC